MASPGTQGAQPLEVYIRYQLHVCRLRNVLYLLSELHAGVLSGQPLKWIDMPHYTDYRCTVCGLECERDVLVVKKINFAAMGAGGKVVRSRTKAWLCDTCLPKDPDWNAEPYSSAPGLKSAALERVRAAEGRPGETR